MRKRKDAGEMEGKQARKGWRKELRKKFREGRRE